MRYTTFIVPININEHWFHTLTSVSAQTMSLKTVKVSLNQKLWFSAFTAPTSTVRVQLWEGTSGWWRRGAYSSYTTTQGNLHRGIRNAKPECIPRIEEHFNTNNSRRMWNSIQALKDCKRTTPDTWRWRHTALSPMPHFDAPSVGSLLTGILLQTKCPSTEGLCRTADRSVYQPIQHVITTSCRPNMPQNLHDRPGTQDIPLWST